VLIRRGIGPWKRSTLHPLDSIRSVDHEPADMRGAPGWLADKEPGQITVHTATATYTMCANHTGQFAEALRAMVGEARTAERPDA
jgi:hypothetical protein